MSDIKFNGAAHRDFFLEMMGKCKVNDSYHRAFFYVMGISDGTRANINQMFNFKDDHIIPEGMHGGWQTSGSVRVCQLAFNLWNGYSGNREGDDSGHAQVKMVADVYSHIIDDDRRINAQRFEEQFYQSKAEPQDENILEEPPMQEASETDQAMLLKLLANPEMASLLKSLAKNI